MPRARSYCETCSAQQRDGGAVKGGKNVFKHKEDFPVWAAVHSERRSHSMAKRHLFVLGHRSPLDSGAADSTTGAVCPQLDCLNPVNHQRLCVLFSSSSAQSNNAPNPCVSPWWVSLIELIDIKISHLVFSECGVTAFVVTRIVTMEFYGKNDLSLGVFLERYCFR